MGETHPTGIAASSQNQERPKVVHIGAGRAADDQIAQRREEAVAVIVFQQRLGAQSERCGVRDRIGAVQRAGVVFRAVDAVGIAGQCMNNWRGWMVFIMQDSP